jgi:uncharacterized membrane protein YiaA
MTEMMAIYAIILVLFIALLRTQRREISGINSHPKWAPVFHTGILVSVWMICVGVFLL